MTTLQRNNDALRVEAGLILGDRGLLALAEARGEVFIGGSFHSDLMVWRDLDVYIGMDTDNLTGFFELGRQVVETFNASKAFFTDARTSDPTGLYWGVRVGDLRAGAWKFDIWAVTPDELARRRLVADAFVAQLTPRTRSTILTLKNHYWNDSRYRSQISSADIYNAVLDHAVATTADFENFLSERRVGRSSSAGRPGPTAPDLVV
jgi:hypothetical protein